MDTTNLEELELFVDKISNISALCSMSKDLIRSKVINIMRERRKAVNKVSFIMKNRLSLSLPITVLAVINAGFPHLLESPRISLPQMQEAQAAALAALTTAKAAADDAKRESIRLQAEQHLRLKQ